MRKKYTKKEAVSIEEFLKLRSEFKDCQKVLTAIGDETRQHLIALMIMEKCSGARVVDIAKKTNLSRPAVSHHMQILKDAGFVYAYKKGTMVYYSLDFNTDAVRKLKALIEHIDVLLKSEEHRNFLKKREEI